MDIKEGLFNPYVDCPYNRAHSVPKLRLQRHLLKCRKQYAHTSMKTCPYNATHIVPEPELKLHFEHCTDRNLIEGQKYSLNAAHGELGNPSFHPDVPFEDWDESDEENHHSSGLHSNHHSSGIHHAHYQMARPVQGEHMDDGGALSQVEESIPQPPVFGCGRGRIQQIVAEMKTGQH